MRTAVTSPEPPPRGTVYTSTSTLNTTRVDLRLADLPPVNPTLAVSTTQGWVQLNP